MAVWKELSQLLESLERACDDSDRVCLLLDISRGYLLRNSVLPARASAEKALSLAYRSSDTHCQAIALSLLAHCDELQHVYDSALKNARKAVALAEDNNDSAIIRIINSRLASISCKLLNVKQASDSITANITLCDEAGDLPEKMRALIISGDIYASMDTYDKALEQYQKAYAILPGLDANPYETFYVLNHIGDCCCRLGLMRKAARFLKKALSLARDYNLPQNHAIALIALGELSLQNDKIPDAAQYACDALTIARDANDADILHAALSLSGAVAREQHRYDAAVAFYSELLQSTGKTRNVSAELAAERALVDVFKRSEDYCSAFTHNLRVAELLAAAYENEKDLIRLELDLRYETDRHNRELELHRLKHSELSEAEKSAYIANQAKSAFLTTMSHELRTPLNAVIGAIDLLVQTPLHQDQQEYARIISASASSLMDIISDLMNLSKIEAGTIDLDSSVFDLESVLEQACCLVALRTAQKHIDLILDCPASLPRFCIGDPCRLQEIFVNLLTNAVKFTESGYVLLSVVCPRQSANDAQFVFSVHDTGIGISPENQKLIFGQFNQVSSLNSPSEKGTGLGLAISKHLVELMHGSISLESIPGSGSVFTVSITLPLAPDLNPAYHPLENKKFLIADSSPVSAHILHKNLSEAGLVCRVVSSLSDAAALFQSPAVINDPFDGMLIQANLLLSDAGSAFIQSHHENHLAVKNILVLHPLHHFPTAALNDSMTCLPLPASTRKIQAALSRLVTSPKSTMTIDSSRTAHSDSFSHAHSTSPSRLCLLVEDAPINQKVTSAMLAKLGFQTDIAANGQVALDMIDHKPYQIILMDCQMPVLDGYNATRALRSRNVTTPIVGVTAYAMEEDRQKCLKAGMNDYLPKPVKISTLKAMLQRWLPDADSNHS